MKLQYGVTGQERKSLASTLSAALNAPTRYLGAPTFAYEVGGYRVDKEGTLTGADNLGLEDALHQAGFDPDADTREYDIPDIRDNYNLGQCGGDVIPVDWEEGMTEEEELGLGRTRREDYQGENGMQAYDAPDTGETDLLTVEIPLAGFTPQTLDNLIKMVAAREALIKAALGTDDLPIQITEESVSFPWFTLDNPSEATCYTQFITALCRTAIAKKRVIAKERDLADNPKYAMRCWLLSLGLIGDAFRNTRKLLLTKLDGNCSFKGGARPTYTAHCYTYPNGSEEDAMDCETFNFTNLSKAKAFCDEFARDCENLKYAGCHVEDDAGNYLYEILADRTVSGK